MRKKFDPNTPPLRKTTVLIRDEEHEIIEVTTAVFEEVIERLTTLAQEVVDLILYGSAVVSSEMTDEQKAEAYKTLEKLALERLPGLVRKFPKELKDCLSLMSGYTVEQIGKWPPDLVVDRLIMELVINYKWLVADLKKKTEPIREILGLKTTEEAKEKGKAPMNDESTSTNSSESPSTSSGSTSPQPITSSGSVTERSTISPSGGS